MANSGPRIDIPGKKEHQIKKYIPHVDMFVGYFFDCYVI